MTLPPHWRMRMDLQESSRRPPKFLPLLYQMYVVHMRALVAGGIPRRPIREGMKKCLVKRR